MQITTDVYEDSRKAVKLDHPPDRCPICHYAVVPSFYYAFCDKRNYGKPDCLQVIFKCPRVECQNLFISYYRPTNSHCETFHFMYSRPVTKAKKHFTKTIKNISETFCKIYSQAFAAEEEGLLEICGVGYRKSLEFLIKDYLITLHPNNEEDVKKKALGKCISEYIKDERIKSVAKRAVWLGNDETHYLRKWEDKDLQDLKKLIDLTVHWLEMEQITKEMINDMPEKT